ncbi:site-specific integrase [Bacteroides xylanisolvens]|uniref:Site-specific integrase n=1 Tax=Bacteroides xylanisolvens TaxID=371601 RepID=A0AAW4SMF7_9BACE|nr:site-specific integrase [Bacteroides xylanisolvens]MCA4465836.1 site-specific integrase [Bacteroides xylanisolvens]MCA4470283.1 site-specific integrase [Bacteroides xylanisolvens]MCA4478197.1 site-specific integrase [Bacteroides xylanisolvens]MCA4487438.1 site-specific integrase [Bacteroides xylanisolvens]MCA4493094.1 site-specific integrase [Bacteroides xylanisolvens]
MANIKFMIRDMDAENEQTIYVSSRFGRNDKLMYATTLKVEPLFWDEKKQRVKNSKYCLNKDDINIALTNIESKINLFITDSASKGSPVTKDDLKNLLDIHFGKKIAAAHDFHSFFEEFIRLCDTRVSPHRGGQTIDYKTKREYARTYYYIQEYEKKRKLRLDFRNINQSFFNDFVAFLQELELSTNTIWHKTVSLKAVMKAANEQELTDNTKYRLFKNVSEESQAIALSENELDLLAHFDFSHSFRLERTRDLFLIGCWTGLRFSDFTRIREENIKNGMLTIQQQKTNEFVTIPLHPVFLRIWEKYNGILPSNISNQKFNDNLKDVCREAGLNEHVLKSITKGGKKQTTVYEKWQLVSSHTARRSFATNLYKSGFPSISIMQITGHKTESSFLKYIKVTKEEHAKMLMMHWQKNGNLLKVM